MFLSWGLGKRTTRPTPGRSPHRWNDAPSCSASIWPPSEEQRPISTLTSESTGPRSGASCNWSGTSALRHTGGSEAVTSAADGTRQSTANLRALGRCSRGGEAIELATAENRRPAGCAIPGKESHRPGRPPGQLVPRTCPTRPEAGPEGETVSMATKHVLTNVSPFLDRPGLDRPRPEPSLHLRQQKGGLVWATLSAGQLSASRAGCRPGRSAGSAPQTGSSAR
jgi:hypothetical protein